MAGQVLAAAAVLGPMVDVDTVRAVSGRSDEETVSAFEELVRLGVLVEQRDGYRFSHDKLRDVVHGDTSLARVEHRLGAVHQRRGEWDLAAARLGAAAERLGGVPGLLARVEADRSLSEHRRGNMDEAAMLAGRALELATEAEDTVALAQARNMLGILAAGRALRRPG